MMKKLLDIFVYVLLLTIGTITRYIGTRLRVRLGKYLSVPFRYLFPSRMDIARDNLKKAFPEKDLDWIERTAKESFENLGITLLEILAMRYLSKSKVKSSVKFENLEMFKEEHAKGRGLILMCAHFGNWELGALSGTLNMGVNYLIIVEHQTNELIDKEMNKIRTRFGNKVVSRYKAAREIVKTLDKGEILALIADQSATKDKDVFVDFFGRPTATFESPAILAKKFNLPVIMGVPVRQKDGTYVITLEKIEHNDLGNSKEDIRELTQRHTKVLEKYIRMYPGHWSWMHRRWKHSPSETVNEEA